MRNCLKRVSVWKIMIVLLGMGVFFVLVALLGVEWGSGNGGLFFQFLYALHFLKICFGSFFLAGAVSLIGAWLGIWALEGLQKPVWWPGILLSLFFTQNTLMHITRPDSLELQLFCPQYNIVDNLLMWCVFSLFYYVLVLAFCQWFSQEKEKANSGRKTWKFWRFSAIIAVCWVPILYLRLPGSILYDTARQILEYQGYLPWEGANPVFLTAIYGFLFSLGQSLGGDNEGLLFCTVFQLLVTLLAMGLACGELERYGKRMAAILLALFYGLCPRYPCFPTMILKDSVYGPLFLLLTVYYIRVLNGGGNADKLRLMLVAFLCALTRKGGIYLSLGTVLCLLFSEGGQKRCYLLFCGVLLAGMVFLEQMLFPYLGIEKPWKQENYSFFYNLTCVYCDKYQQELTPQDIETIAAVLDYDAVLHNYSPYSIDSIKNTFHGKTNDQIRDYLLLNLKFILRHPLIVEESLLRSKGLYFDPFDANIDDVNGAQQRAFDDIAPGASSVFSYYAPNSIRKPLEEKFFDWSHERPQALLLSSGSYSWMCLLLVAVALWQRSRKKLLMVLPTFLAMMGLLLTHTNGTIRYAAPVILAAPMLFACLRCGCSTAVKAE